HYRLLLRGLEHRPWSMVTGQIARGEFDATNHGGYRCLRCDEWQVPTNARNPVLRAMGWSLRAIACLPRENSTPLFPLAAGTAIVVVHDSFPSCSHQRC